MSGTQVTAEQVLFQSGRAHPIPKVENYKEIAHLSL